MKFCSPVVFVTLLQFFYFSPSRAQQLPDSSLYYKSLSSIHAVYFNGIGDNAQIYHGTEYIRNGLKAQGFPFYESDGLQSGSVYYQGMLYINMGLFYDLVSDQVICNNYEQKELIGLSSEKADSFTIGNHFFIWMSANKSKGLEKDGYYDRLYAGNIAFYVKREKKFSAGAGSEEARYILNNSYFIEIRNIFYLVYDKSSLLDLLKDQKDALKKYIRTNKLNFRKDLESSLVLATIYYSELKH